MFKKNNEKGFTLIELMIVIAIIGILAAVAIPNFISYRNKAFCSAAESDANMIAAEIANYYSIPNRTKLVTKADLSLELSGSNDYTIGGTVDAIVITVTDGSGLCPSDYRTANSDVWTGQTVVKNM